MERRNTKLNWCEKLQFVRRDEKYIPVVKPVESIETSAFSFQLICVIIFVLQVFCSFNFVCIEMTRENEIRKENIGCNGWIPRLLYCSRSHSLTLSLGAQYSANGSPCMLCRNRKKVVSSCFLHCNANSNKYMHISACNEYIPVFVLNQQRESKCYSNDERTHFYVNCIPKWWVCGVYTYTHTHTKPLPSDKRS